MHPNTTTPGITTAGIAPVDRFDHWVGEIGRTMSVAVDARAATPDRFQGRVAGNSVGDIHFCWVSADPMQVRRTRRLTARVEEDYYKFGLQISGTGLVEQDGQRCRIGPRDLVICDTSRPYSFTYDCRYQTMLALVPQALIPFGPDVLRSVAARRIAGGDGTAAIVASFLQSLTGHLGSVGDPALPRVMEGAVSLFTGLLAERVADGRPEWSEQAMMLRIRDHIDRHLAEPDLTPDAIAAAFGISRRYLFKLFAGQETTVAGCIRAQRLARCARDLADPSMRERSVGRVAMRWGLADTGHFARLFKTAYGRTPRDFRKQALDTEHYR